MPIPIVAEIARLRSCVPPLLTMMPRFPRFGLSWKYTVTLEASITSFLTRFKDCLNLRRGDWTESIGAYNNEKKLKHLSIALAHVSYARRFWRIRPLERLHEEIHPVCIILHVVWDSFPLGTATKAESHAAKAAPRREGRRAHRVQLHGHEIHDIQAESRYLNIIHLYHEQLTLGV